MQVKSYTSTGKILREQRGAEYIEYSIMAIAMAVVLIILIGMLGKEINAKLESSRVTVFGD